MKEKVVVTGGAGFIGSYLSSKLAENGYDVIVYDDFSNASGRMNLLKGIRIIKKSILDFSSLKSCLKNVNAVFNLAVKPLPMSFNKPEEVMKVNDYGTYLVCKACTELKCKLVHVSSSEAYGTAQYTPMDESHPTIPSTIYAASKAASESYVKAFELTDGLKATIIRPFNSYGPFMRDDIYAAALPKFYNRLSKKLPPIIFGDGNQTRDFTFADDIAYGMILANENSAAIGDVFNIAQGRELSIKKMAKIMIKKYAQITNQEIKPDLQFQKPRKGDVKRHFADISHAKKILGYKPKISFEEGVEKYINWKLTRNQ